MYIISIFVPSRPINSGREEDVKGNWIAARCGELWSADDFISRQLCKYTELSPIQVGDQPAEQSAKGVAQCSIMLERCAQKEDFCIFEMRNREYNPYRDEMWTVIDYIAVIRIK